MFDKALRADKERTLVLIIDDDQVGRLLLRWMLEQEDYAILEAQNGQEGLDLYHHHQPDLILLDGVMPVMDGFETCYRLRQLPQAEQVPILMVTGLEDTSSVEKAFAAGATDYITKPVHWPVLRQRVRRLLAHQEAEKVRDDLTNMIVHDMKTPLAAITGLGELLLEGHIGEISSEQFDLIQRMVHNGQTLLELTGMILDVARLRDGRLEIELQEMPMGEIIKQALDHVKYLAQKRNINLQVDCTSLATAMYDWNLLKRVLLNLLTNVIKYSPAGGTIWLTVKQQPDKSWQIVVKDEGERIEPSDQYQIFEQFAQSGSSNRRWSGANGLGLTFCKLVVEAHGGKIEIDSSLNTGAIFTLLLPENVPETKSRRRSEIN